MVTPSLVNFTNQAHPVWEKDKTWQHLRALQHKGSWTSTCNLVTTWILSHHLLVNFPLLPLQDTWTTLKLEAWKEEARECLPQPLPHPLECGPFNRKVNQKTWPQRLKTSWKGKLPVVPWPVHWLAHFMKVGWWAMLPHWIPITRWLAEDLLLHSETLRPELEPPPHLFSLQRIGILQSSNKNWWNLANFHLPQPTLIILATPYPGLEGGTSNSKYKNVSCIRFQLLIIPPTPFLPSLTPIISNYYLFYFYQ